MHSMVHTSGLGSLHFAFAIGVADGLALSVAEGVGVADWYIANSLDSFWIWK